MNIEKKIIASMMMDKGTISTVNTLGIREDDFTDVRLGLWFTAMRALYCIGKPIDLITVQDMLKYMGEDPQIASLDRMKELMEVVK